MKKVFSIMMAAFVLLSVLVVAVSAAEVTSDGTTYELIQPTAIAFEWQGIDDAHEVKNFPRQNKTLEVLIDGELVRDASGFDTAGIVLVQNAWIPANGVQGSSPADQPDEEIPTWSFDLDLGAEKSFDTAYLGLYHEIASCIAIPGNKAVVVETSKDGATWVSVGNGTFYFNSAVGDYNGAGDQGIDECLVYLGKEVKSRYVRLTFTFMKVPEDGYWTNYTNVYEWCGFTEVGVAKYKSGKKPKAYGEEDVNKDPTKVEGLWICDMDEEIVIFEFIDNHGAKTATFKYYDAEAFNADPLTAEPTDVAEYTYSVLGTTVTLSEGKNTMEIEAELNEAGNLLLEMDGDSLMLDPYTWPQPAESSEEPTESSEEPTESSEEPAESSEEPAESSEEPAATSSEEPAAESSAATSEPAENEGGLSTGAIVGIVIGAIVVIGGAVAGIILAKKKKK